MITPDDLTNRGVYGVFDERGYLQYVGSTTCNLHNLEKNHREWRSKKYSPTLFRRTLENVGQNWRFVWLVSHNYCNAYAIESLERDLILMLKPALNIDKDPVASSIKYG